MAFVTRAQWGARPPKSTARITAPVSTVFIHHTVTPTGPDAAVIVRSAQRYHMDTQGWPDIAYSFLVSNEPGGVIYEGRNWGVVGTHTANWNSRSYAVAWIGNSEIEAPTADALDAMAWIIADGVRRGHITRSFELRGHKDVNATGCPGSNLYGLLDDIKARVERHLGAPPAPAPTPAPQPDLASLAAAIESAKRQVVRRGSRGDAVKWAQAFLNKHKQAGLAVDGVFGASTEAAVRRFQTDINGFFGRRMLAVDGVVGPSTWFWLAR